MSQSVAEAVLKRLNEDEELRAAVVAAQTSEEKRSLLEAKGFYDFTEEEVLAAAPTLGLELSDAELEAVAGGRVVEWVAATAAVVGAAAAAGA